MGGGGSESESTSKLPDWYTGYAKRSLALADKIAQKGFVPNYGPSVAAFAPQQVAGMQNANDWSAAFGKPGAKSANVAASLMPAQNFAGGLRGYSSLGGFKEAMQKFQRARPGQDKFIRGFSIDPRTGAPARNYESLGTIAKALQNTVARPGEVVMTPQERERQRRLFIGQDPTGRN